MGRLAACTAVLALLGAPAWAEQKNENPRPTPRQLAENLTQRLAEPLGLSEEQAAKVTPVLRRDLERKQEIFDTYRGRVDQSTVRQLGEALQVSQDQTRAELAPILDEEQMARFDEVQEEQRAQAAGELIVHRLQGRLALTPEQQDELVPIFANHVARQQAALKAARSTGGRGVRALRAMRGKNQELQQELEKKLKPILSAEQMEGYREYRKETQAQMRQRMRGQDAAQP
jgi:hypothetical protein